MAARRARASQQLHFTLQSIQELGSYTAIWGKVQ